MSRELIRKAALNAAVPVELVTVPEWDDQQVELRGLTAGEQHALTQKIRDRAGDIEQAKFYPALIIACTFDPESGERVLDDADMDTLLAGPASVINRLGSVAAALSGFGDLDEEAADLG